MISAQDAIYTEGKHNKTSFLKKYQKPSEAMVFISDERCIR